MCSDEKDAPWGQLVSVTDLFSEPVEICKKKFTIGRAKGCDLCFPTNKLVSSSHCYIERDEDDEVWLRDTSTNGTLLRSAEKVLNQRRHLQHGDEFYLVYKKNHPEFNIGYVFQDWEALRKEADEATQSYSEQLDATLQDDSAHDVASVGSSTSEKETRESLCPALKKRKVDGTTSNQASTSGAGDGNHGNKDESGQESIDQALRVQEDSSLTKDEKPETTDEKPEPTNEKPETKDEKPEAKDEKPEPTNEKPEPTNEKPETKDEKPEAKDEKPEPTNEKPETKDEKPEAKDEKPEPTNEKQETKDEKPETRDEKSETTNEKLKNKSIGGDGIAESLICIICQEILHNCISLQPCLHSFCAGCYSDWMDRSNECPSCRVKVERINKNHMVVNLVEAYLKQHPDKKRPEEDLRDLDAKNKITRDMLYPKTPLRTSEDSEEGDYHRDSDAYSDEGSPSVFQSGLEIAGNAMGRALYDLGATIHGRVHPPAVMCRQCPGFQEFRTGNTSTPAGGAGTNSGETTATTSTSCAMSATAQPSTSGVSSTNQDPDDNKVMPTPPPYQCGVYSTHVMCSCCYQIMPDRRNAHHTNPAVPAMSCVICYRNFCHAYWGCRKADCRGCLNKFGEMNFGKKCLANILLDNVHESQILVDYLNAKSISVKDVLQICLERMERGEYKCQDQYPYNLSSQTYLCYSCGLRNFKDLAYYYRRDIPRYELPDTVTSRPDCYWGKNCNTQKHKLHHAQRFNHICDATRGT